MDSNDDVLLKASSGNIIPKIMQHATTYFTNQQFLLANIEFLSNICSCNFPEVITKILNNSFLDFCTQILINITDKEILILTFYALANFVADAEYAA